MTPSRGTERALAFVLAALWGLGFGTAAVAANGAARDEAALRGGRAYLPGVVVVKIAATQMKAAVRGGDGALQRTGSAGLDRVLAAHGVQSVRPVAARLRGQRRAGGTDLSRVFVAELGDGADALAVARELASRPEVEYAEPQFVYPLASAPGDPLYTSEQSTYFQRMQFPAAFDVTHGGNGNVVVAIVDGGTEWRHQDLQANVWTNPGEIAGNLVDDDGNGYVDDVHGWNFANHTNDPTGLAATPGSAGHGTHTAGIVCAVTDNALGVAGASWNAHFMPVCAAHPTADNAVAYGYQGILYAVDAGADIVSCSWGGLGNPSLFEKEVTDYAAENGVVIVAAAGNNNSSSEFYPAAYPRVLAVANLGNTDVRSSSSNYGPWVDLAAQGTAIHSTYSNNSYADLSGTSMAAPQVAAACALVKTKFPAYTAVQVAERVRVTCDNVDSVNPSVAGLLGHGRVNAVQALTRTTPAIRIQQVTATTSDGDAVIEPGETVNLAITVVNYLDPCQQAAFTLSTTSALAGVTNGAATAPALGSGQSFTLTGFTFNVGAGAPLNTTLPFRLDISTTNPNTTDVDRFELRVLPSAATHAANRVVATVTSVGRLGFADVPGGTGKDGAGFQYAGSGNLLFEGALLLGTGAGSVSNAARGSSPSIQDADFVTAANGVPVIAPRPPYTEFGTASFTDAGATSPLGIRIRQESWELATPPYADFLVLACTLRNTSGSKRNGLYAGWFLDWDLDAIHFATNRTGFDAGRGLAYAWDTGSGPDDYVGALVLTPPGTTTCRGIWNDPSAPGNTSWGIYDGFTDAEKWDALSGGTSAASAGPADISQVIGTGPFALAAGESLVVAFAFLGGSSLADLQAHADVARSVWQHPVDAGAGRTLPLRVQLEPNYPNPFNPETRIAFLLPHPALVSLRVYAVSGRVVRTLADGLREAGPHDLLWDGRDDLGRPAPSGTYFLRLAADGSIQTRKLQLMK